MAVCMTVILYGNYCTASYCMADAMTPFAFYLYSFIPPLFSPFLPPFFLLPFSSLLPLTDATTPFAAATTVCHNTNTGVNTKIEFGQEFGDLPLLTGKPLYLYI